MIKLYLQDSLDLPFVFMSKTHLSINLLQLCSFALNHMLCFLNSAEVEHILIPRQPAVFNDCKQCNHHGNHTLLTLCHIFQNSLKLARLDLSNCGLSTNSCDQIATALLSNKGPSLKQLDLRQNHIYSIAQLSQIFSKGLLSLSVCEFQFKSDGEDKIEIIQLLQSKANLEVVFETFVIPDKF